MVDSESVNKVLIKLMNMLTAVVVPLDTTIYVQLSGFPRKQKQQQKKDRKQKLNVCGQKIIQTMKMIRATTM